MTSSRSLSAPPGGARLSSDTNHFGYRWGELSVGGPSPSTPSLSPWRSRTPPDAECGGPAEWRQSPYYGGNRHGPHARRNYGGVYYRRKQHGLPRSYSSSGVYAEGGDDPLFPEQGRGARFEALRSFSMPASSRGTSYAVSPAPGSRHEGRFSEALGSFAGAAKGIAEIPPLLASAMSKQQITRVRASLQSSTTPSQGGVRLKLVELLEYWMSDALTGTAVEELIAEVYQEAGARGESSSDRGEEQVCV
ncbi:protein phosphatase 2 (formerly 2A), regulatory subunit B [Trypanosoma conorhini]|uniref:Protein phosphatase 2 (Formerly 2A), regulatory subunit B n=1 Tax=Trypanosoma conorhini TaxID=83891 RepID=A0A3R7M6F2_9TRYP|nr:protein phosphatase 2 (formerly 2A), regulatory subunit B [Trypanosoma conorhini]RNF09953.1 protein phosphatase 2 (formerly 2A), regulatory subunit B [Trypanosoma conorhini]